MKCPHCGASIYDDINRCQYCGSYVTPVQQQAPAQQGQQQPVIVNVYQPEPQTIHHETHIYHTEPVSEKNRLVALLLCLFFGGLGFHKFYLGRVGMGILYLFTLGLCGIGVFVDLLVLLFGTPRDGHGAKLKWS